MQGQPSGILRRGDRQMTFDSTVRSTEGRDQFIEECDLFPDVSNSELRGLLEKQGKELKQAKQTILALQGQVSSLTDQLQSLVDDLAEVKDDDKYSISAKTSFHNYGNSPRTPVFDHEETLNSLEFSYSDPTAPGSLGDLFIKDLNPCLTPDYVKNKSKEYEERCFASSETGSSASYKSMNTRCHICQDAHGEKLSRSSDCCELSNINIRTTHTSGTSEESQYAYRKPMHQRLYWKPLQLLDLPVA